MVSTQSEDVDESQDRVVMNPQYAARDSGAAPTRLPPQRPAVQPRRPHPANADNNESAA